MKNIYEFKAKGEIIEIMEASNIEEAFRNMTSWGYTAKDMEIVIEFDKNTPYGEPGAWSVYQQVVINGEVYFEKLVRPTPKS